MSEDLVYRSFEIAADRSGDISPAVYDKYFAKCPNSKELMSHIDGIVRGRMMDEVYRLLMIDGYEQEQGYLNFEVKNHQFAYSVEPHMYENLLIALQETIEDSLAEDWNDAYAAAWNEKIGSLLGEIQQRLAANNAH